MQAFQIVQASRDTLADAQAAVREATEMFRKLEVISFGMTGRRKELETVEPILAIQQMAQARYQYLAAIVDYNRAQLAPYFQIGQPRPWSPQARSDRSPSRCRSVPRQ